MTGMRLIDAHGGKDGAVNRAVFRKWIENGYKSLDDETLEYTPDGEPLWFLSNTIGIIENGQTKEGTIKVPKVLQAYVGKEEIGKE